MRIPLAAAALTVAAFAETAFTEPAVAESAIDPVIGARLDPVIDRALSEKRIVGAVVLVAKDGTIVYHRAAGYADREAGAEMREDAIFRLASITKPFVTAAAMRLVEDGRLDLDAPVTRWLPDFRPALPDGSTPDITIHQLLTHTSGLGYTFLEPAGGPYHRLNVSDGLDQPGLSLKENLARLSAAPLTFAPGTGWRYSLGIDVLGGVLETIEGRSLSDIVRDTVTAPLGISDTGFSVRDASRLTKAYADGDPEPVAMMDRLAVPLMGFAATFAPSRILDANSYQSGGAGMAGTASDVLRFLEAIRTGGSPILKPETVRMMVRDQVGATAQTQGPGWGFGYGWAVLDDPAPTGTPQAAGTLQWGGAYGHSWFIDRRNGLSVVALTNTAFEGMSGAFPTDVRNAVYGQNRR
ncbi:serine hydrolase [Azospirillum sp. TSH58]|nr:serine hydrolase [Azospirillum sp. TSH58]